MKFTLLLLLLTNTALCQDNRIKIAVIDTGVNFKDSILKPYLCKDGHMDFTGEGVQDTHGHGTNVASLIAKNLDYRYQCLLILKYYTHGFGYNNLNNEILSFLEAEKQGASYINLSGGGTDKSKLEYEVMTRLNKKGIRMIVAAGNNGYELTDKQCYFPACYGFSENFYVVGSLNQEGKPASSSNWGSKVSNWLPGLIQKWGNSQSMSGTSQATANFTGELVKKEWIESHERRY